MFILAVPFSCPRGLSAWQCFLRYGLHFSSVPLSPSVTVLDLFSYTCGDEAASGILSFSGRLFFGIPDILRSMKESHEVFSNELGNTIDLKVFEKEIHGIPGVLISLAGPSSVSENHVTRHEAEMIHKHLSVVLNNELI